MNIFGYGFGCVSSSSVHTGFLVADEGCPTLVREGCPNSSAVRCLLKLNQLGGLIWEDE